MILFNPISAEDLYKQSKNISEVFPFAWEYINSSVFRQDRYEWFYITDDSLSTEDARNTWIGLVCVTENKYYTNGNLHLSVLEVAEPLRGLHFGTAIMDKLIDIARNSNYVSFTLQARTPDLVGFYRRFEFRTDYARGGIELQVLDL